MVYEMLVIGCSFQNDVHHARWERGGYTSREVQVAISMVRDGKIAPYVQPVLAYYAEIYPSI